MNIVFILCIVCVIVILISKLWIYSAASYYSKKHTAVKINAEDIASNILIANSIYDVFIIPCDGFLTDSYNPRYLLINLSERVYGNSSIMALSIAAHEASHAVQHREGYRGLEVRRNLQPVTSLTIVFAALLFIIWVFTRELFILVILCIIVLIAVVTRASSLPSEFDASRRALQALRNTGRFSGKEIRQARLMLRASAFTYVAGLFDVILKVVIAAIVMLMSKGEDKK